MERSVVHWESRMYMHELQGNMLSVSSQPSVEFDSQLKCDYENIIQLEAHQNECTSENLL